MDYFAKCFLGCHTPESASSDSWATFALREVAVETLSVAPRWTSLSLDLFFDLLSFLLFAPKQYVFHNFFLILGDTELPL